MKKMLKLIAIQIAVLILLLIIDLYVFRGYYSSKISIDNKYFGTEKDYSSSLRIIKVSDTLYHFKLKNETLLPKYFINYRNEELIQEVNDELVLNYLGRNINPNYSNSYSLGFDCGTGLGLTSLNPLESSEIYKSYDQIIEECDQLELLRNIGASYRYKNWERSIDYEKNDSILKFKYLSISSNDSIDVEYFFNNYSFISKNNKTVCSNKIKVSIKDLLESYMKQDSIYEHQWSN